MPAGEGLCGALRRAVCLKPFEVGVSTQGDKAAATKQYGFSLQFKDADMEERFRSQQLDYIWTPIQWIIGLRTMMSMGSAWNSFDADSAEVVDWIIMIVHVLGPLISLGLLSWAREKPKGTRIWAYDMALDAQMLADVVMEAALYGRLGEPLPPSVYLAMTGNTVTHMPWAHHMGIGTLGLVVHALATWSVGAFSLGQVGLALTTVPFFTMFARFAGRALRQDFATRTHIAWFRNTMAGHVKTFCKDEQEAEATAAAVTGGTADAGGGGGAEGASLDTLTSLYQTFDLANKLTNRIVESEQRQSLFLATMSHELRSPLSAMLGALDCISTSRTQSGTTGEAAEPVAPGPAAATGGAKEDDAADGEEELGQMLELMDSSGQHLLSLVNDILDFTKLADDTSTLTLHPSTFSVRALGKQVLDEYLPQAEESGVQLLVTFPHVPPGTQARADRRRIKQVLVNFLSNALKFTPAGGSVYIQLGAAPTARPTGHPDLDLATTALTLAVIDTGIGIAAEAQRELFVPFTQADNSLTRKYGGTGLGLCISAKLVECLGGQPIKVQSAPDEGSRFSAKIPCPVWVGDAEADAKRPVAAPAGCGHPRSGRRSSVGSGSEGGGGGVIGSARPSSRTQGAQPLRPNPAPAARAPAAHSTGDTKVDASARAQSPVAPAQAQAQAPAQAQESLPALRILVAEDMRMVRKVAKQMLHRCGSDDVHFVENGELAHAAVRSAAAQGRPFDLVLMDYHMPVCNGAKATELIIRDTVPPPTIVGLTADVTQEAIASFLSAGAHHVMNKPVTCSTLLETLEEVQRIRQRRVGIDSVGAIITD